MIRSRGCRGESVETCFWRRPEDGRSCRKHCTSPEAANTRRHRREISIFVQFDVESQAGFFHIWKHQIGMGYLTKRNPFVPRRFWWPKCDGINVGFDVKEMKFLPYKTASRGGTAIGRLPDMEGITPYSKNRKA